MKNARFALLAVAAIAASSLAANTPGIPDTWHLFIKVPAYTAYQSGAMDIIQQDPLIWKEWHKVAYSNDQSSLNGPYRSRLMYLQIDCSKRQVAVLRDLRYTAKGSIVSDISDDPDHPHFMGYDRTAQRLSDEAVVFDLALVHQDNTCTRAD
jgi:hypothetical protein